MRLDERAEDSQRVRRLQMKPSLEFVDDRGGNVSRGIPRVGLPKDLDVGGGRGHPSLRVQQRSDTADGR